MNQDRDAFLFSLPDSGLQPEQVLWLHVMAQAIIDAAAKQPDVRKEVEDWIKSEDFEVVCGMAGLNKIHIKATIEGILNEKDHRKAFREAMKYRFLFRTYIESYLGEIDLRGGHLVD